MARVDTLGNFLTDVADAIRTKTGSSETIQASDFDTAIENIPSGGSTEVPEKDVNFYDYDGTRVYSYTKDEFLALESLPANPTHEGLTAQGWNSSYQDMMAYVSEYGVGETGQMYITDDGKTRIYIDLQEYATSPYLRVNVTRGSVTINWGDESEEQSGVTGSDFIQHNYSTHGKYVITIAPDTDETVFNFTGSFSQGSYLLSNAITSTTYSEYAKNQVYQKSVYKVEIGSNFSFAQYAFNQLGNLTSITIPNTNLTTNMVSGTGLKCIVVPNYDMLTQTLASNANPILTIFKMKISTYNYPVIESLGNKRSIIIPETSGGSPFTSKISSSFITKITIPKNYNSFNQLFSTSLSPFYSLKCVDFTHHTSVPTLSGTNSFNSTPSDCKIVVPDDLYEDWIVADVWSDSSIVSKIISKSDWEAQQ